MKKIFSLTRLFWSLIFIMSTFIVSAIPLGTRPTSIKIDDITYTMYYYETNGKLKWIIDSSKYNVYYFEYPTTGGIIMKRGSIDDNNKFNVTYTEKLEYTNNSAVISTNYFYDDKINNIVKWSSNKLESNDLTTDETEIALLKRKNNSLTEAFWNNNGTSGSGVKIKYNDYSYDTSGGWNWMGFIVSRLFPNNSIFVDWIIDANYRLFYKFPKEIQIFGSNSTLSATYVFDYLVSPKIRGEVIEVYNNNTGKRQYIQVSF